LGSQKSAPERHLDRATSVVTGRITALRAGEAAEKDTVPKPGTGSGTFSITSDEVTTLKVARLGANGVVAN